MNIQTKAPFLAKSLSTLYTPLAHTPPKIPPFRFPHPQHLRPFTTAPMDPQIPRILTFWFSLAAPPHSFTRWFLSDPTLDAQIASTFGPLVAAAGAKPSPLDTWTSTPSGTLALLLLLDQFPRNIYRGTPAAFTSDAKALTVTTHAIARGFDRAVEPIQQAFFYLPLMHAENLLAQVAAVACYEGLVARAEEGSRVMESATRGMGFARGHLEVVRRFGRFSSRNGILGRESTGEEEEFLREHPGGF